MKKLILILILFTAFSNNIVLSQKLENTALIALDSINSEFDDSSPFVESTSKQLFFSKRNKAGDTDAFLAEWNGTSWSNNPISLSINNRFDNEIYHVDSKGLIYFQKAILNNAGQAIFGIFTTEFNEGKWSIPIRQSIKYFNNKSSDQSFCLNKHGDIMLISMQSYFSYGVEDIYVSFRNDNNSWTEPKNLGNSINTPYEEFTPFLDDDDRTLYFSSNGHPGGFGSKDIWVSYRLDSTWTKWSSPVNLGANVNTMGMEMSFRKTGISQIPFLVVSSRTSDGQSDIFGLKLDKSELDSLILAVKPVEKISTTIDSIGEINVIIDSNISANLSDTINAVDSLNTHLLDSTNNILIISTKNRSNNQAIPSLVIYKNRIKSDSIYLERDSVLEISCEWLDTVEINVRSQYFLPQTKTIIFENRHFGIKLEEEIFLDSLEIGKSIQFEHVLFKRGTPELLDQSYGDLDYVAQILNKNEDLNIQIAGHTDNSGNAYLNYILSEKRANTIKKYLINKGINPARIETKGYGGTQPIASNESEETMKLNRRVEFKLIKNK
ncbi:OmpA family protein [Hyphobacterium sp. CCMP332]|nr:OmpA family protein [Hyphobacterium sp. CCMP332]